MSKFQIAIRKFSVYFAKPIWSFIVNCVFWLFRLNMINEVRKIKADILNLYSAKEGHAICVTKDRTKMVTNERVVELNPATWEDDILRYFGNKYEVII